MEEIKNNPLSLQWSLEDFTPASVEDKESLVFMRESVSFWKDGLHRFRKNKIAMSALFIVFLISKEQATKDFCMTMIIGLGAAGQLERRMKDEKTSLKDNRVYQFSFALLFLSYGACILNYFVFHTNLINRACLILYIGILLFNLFFLNKKRQSLVS